MTNANNTRDKWFDVNLPEPAEAVWIRFAAPALVTATVAMAALLFVAFRRGRNCR